MAFTTPTSPRGLSPDITYLPPESVAPQALVYQLTTNAGAIEGDAPVVRVPYVSDDGTASFVPEGGEIGAAGAALDEVQVSTSKLAAISEISGEMRRNRSATAAMVTAGMGRALTAKADAVLLTAAAADPGPTGLLEVTGITDGGSLGANLDVFTDAVASVEAVGGALTAWVMHPSVWARLAKLKVASGNSQTVLSTSSPESATIRAINGVPVITSRHAAATAILGVDASAVVSAIGTVELAVSDQASFTRDSSLIRITWRIGWEVVHADRLVKIAVGA